MTILETSDAIVFINIFIHCLPKVFLIFIFCFLSAQNVSLRKSILGKPSWTYRIVKLPQEKKLILNKILKNKKTSLCQCPWSNIANKEQYADFIDIYFSFISSLRICQYILWENFCVIIITFVYIASVFINVNKFKEIPWFIHHSQYKQSNQTFPRFVRQISGNTNLNV